MDIYVGMEFANKKGWKWRVKEILNMRNIIVESLEWHPYTTCVRKEVVIKGTIMYPYGKAAYGLYRGEGKWDVVGKNRYYRHLKGIFERCYNPKVLEKYSSYKGCTVSEEWHNLQNFCNWCESTYPKDVEHISWEIDKDLLSGEAKTYGPSTCCWLPKELNLFLAKKHIKSIYEYEGEDGTTYYRVWCRQGREKDASQNHYVGSFSSYVEAEDKWKEEKQRRLNALIEKYKEYLPSHVLKALQNIKL